MVTSEWLRDIANCKQCGMEGSGVFFSCLPHITCLGSPLLAARKGWRARELTAAHPAGQSRAEQDWGIVGRFQPTGGLPAQPRREERGGGRAHRRAPVRARSHAPCSCEHSSSVGVTVPPASPANTLGAAAYPFFLWISSPGRCLGKGTRA